MLWSGLHGLVLHIARVHCTFPPRTELSKKNDYDYENEKLLFSSPALCLHNEGLVRQLVKHTMNIVSAAQRNSTSRLSLISVNLTFPSVALRGWISKPVGDSVQ